MFRMLLAWPHLFKLQQGCGESLRIKDVGCALRADRHPASMRPQRIAAACVSL